MMGAPATVDQKQLDDVHIAIVKKEKSRRTVLMYSFDEVKEFDPEVAEAIKLEVGRQNDHIELIASENFVSKAVMAAMGSWLTNKYAEGYPGKDTTADASMLILLRTLPLKEQRSFSDVIM